MSAFLSHSSKDKAFVRQVATALGLECEYDEYSFESTFNIQAIRRALGRSSVFVLFLSKDSIRSSYVADEQRAALAGLGRGFIKRILIFCLDDTSYQSLPEWLRDVNVTHKIHSPKLCARRIHMAILGAAAEEERSISIYVGRDSEEKLLRQALANPPGNSPVAVHVVGHHGIGRRTFLKHCLGNAFPGVVKSYLEITLAQFQGPDDLYRSLSAAYDVSSLVTAANDFAAFSALSVSEKVAKLFDRILDISENGELLLIVDDGGVYDDGGEYHSYLRQLTDRFAEAPRPVFGFIQTRMMPYAKRFEIKAAYHTYLRALSEDATRELLSLSLKQEGINFNDEQLDAVAELLDGHPFNVKFAVGFIREHGIDAFAFDPSELIEWKRKRAEDFLRKITFQEIEVEVLALLSDYRYLAIETLVAVLPDEPAVVGSCLRRLEELCCIELRDPYYHLSPPIRDAVARDRRFVRDARWKQQIAAAICKVVEEYRDEDELPVAILDSAVVAASRGDSPPAFLSSLILPSHLLLVARDYYDKGNRAACAEFCKRAFDMKDRLTPDAQIEVLRLWALSAARSNDRETFDRIAGQLATYGVKTARRNLAFIRGFYARLRNKSDDAERFFLEAHELGPTNQSINRELAQLYCRQRRYPEAEAFARLAYEGAPTSPFVIDSLLETLLGMQRQGMKVDHKEVARLFDELQEYGDRPGASFHLVRTAQQLSHERDFRGARDAAGKAIERTPHLLQPYLLRAEANLNLNDVPAAEKDLAEINRLIAQGAAGAEGIEGQAEELEILINIERHQFDAAKRKILASRVLPKRVAERLERELATAISYAPDAASPGMREWAKAYPISGKR